MTYSTRIICLLLLLPILSTGCVRKRELGNVLRVAVRDKPKSLDPALGSDYYSHVMMSRTYESLLEFHYLKRPYVVEPLLVEALPAISKDGLTYTFKIKKGVLFNDDAAFKDGKGKELTASDVIYTYKRLADPKVMSDSWWILDGRIAGLNAWRDQAQKSGVTDYDAPVEGLKATDPYTLQIKLVKVNPILLELLAMPSTGIVAREVVEKYGKEFVQHPVGTGPFRLDYLSPNQAIWLRNAHFHGQSYPSEGAPGDKEAGLLADAGKPIPFVDKIVDDIVIEDQPAWLNFMQGEHDYLMKIPKDNQTAVFDEERKPRKELRDKNIQVFTTPGVWFSYVAFNMEDPQVGGDKNKYLRTAMALAYDEGPAIEKFYLGLALKAESPIPPGIPGYDPNYKNPVRQYNLVKAREILAKAGHPNGEGIPELTYDAPNDTTQRQIAEYFQRQMAQLGVKIKLNLAAWPEMLGRVRKKQTQVWGASWLYDFPDAENGWQLLYSKNESPGSNVTNFKNKKYDALYEKIATLKDGPERFALFQKMKEVQAEEVPWIITVHQMETRMANAWVHNFKTHAFEHNVEKYLRIDRDAREKALK